MQDAELETVEETMDDSTLAGKSGIDAMLKDNPGAEVTEEQQAEIDRAKDESSANLVAQSESLIPHVHIYRRGMLPGGKYVKNCIAPNCDERVVEIPFAEWERIAL